VERTNRAALSKRIAARPEPPGVGSNGPESAIGLACPEITIMQLTCKCKGFFEGAGGGAKRGGRRFGKQLELPAGPQASKWDNPNPGPPAA
jgi:hypothetical protein